ncbi:hypothetical protein [Raineyella sp. W15-4]|uniref:hypothetical protein n=1 Tax=Raineyella sp. W15-4 TaxID=3081651 RepID=UPI003989FCB2
MDTHSFRRVPDTHGGRSLSRAAPKHATAGPQVRYCRIGPLAPGHKTDGPQGSEYSAKSDLAARPIYHRTRESIEAHLTVVFAALALARTIQTRTGISIKKFLQTLRPLQSAVINTGTQIITIPPAIPPQAQDILDALPGRGMH